MKNIIFIVFLFFNLNIIAQEFVPIYNIQGSGNASPYQDNIVETSGIVTAKILSGSIGFFIQDKDGDSDTNTSDGIFVYNNSILNSIEIGNFITLTGKISEYNNKTEIINVSNYSIDNQIYNLPTPVEIFATDDFSNLERYESMLVTFTQPLIINDVRRYYYYGQIQLSSFRRRGETEIAIRKGDEIPIYDSLKLANDKNSLWLDDAVYDYWENIDVIRNGQSAGNITGILDQINISYQIGSQYVIHPNHSIEFEGRLRSETPDFQQLGDYQYIVATFNIRQFHNTDSRQTNKIISAMKAMNADLFGICEVGQGAPLNALLNALNAAYGSQVYSCIQTNLPNSDIYISSAFFYKNGVVLPVGDYQWDNSNGILYRKLYQKFRFSTGDTILANVNHFKAKGSGGSGLDADQGDGQDGYNHSRVLDATQTVNNLNTFKVKTPKILVMGDLNSLANEEPIRIFKSAGYEHQSEKFNADEYSYSYNGKVQYLDYLLASDSLAKYVTGAIPWHINCDESDEWEYDEYYENTPYRSSDHDPVLLGLRFNDEIVANQDIAENSEKLLIYPNPVKTELRITNYELRNGETIEVYDISGKLLITYHLSHITTIDVSQLQSGIYFIKIGEQIAKFVKE